ncbi:MAG: hypothetical protein K8T25_05780 [Planctomycetia bacterium]|nr:hypothetical protein [Planctomycetia bacterium]
MANLTSLDIIDVATPCSADWNQMTGDDRVRFCGECSLNVYQISELTRVEALKLINDHEGRLCVRLFRRHDGTILTRDCPIGLRAVRRRLARAITAVATLLGILTFGTVFARASSNTASSNPDSGAGPLARLAEWIEGDPPPPIAGRLLVPDPQMPVGAQRP